MPVPQTSAASGLDSKENELRALMRRFGRVLVAYSGGVDSSYLALVATQELGPDSATCVIGISPSVSTVQRREAAGIAADFGFTLEEIATDEMADPNYLSNPANRCYYCKTELYGKLRAIAADRGIDSIVDGTNADDLGDHRPGRAAAGENLVRSPLAELGFTKVDIRELSRRAGLPGWDKPASPCLSSRIAYGVPVTIERLTKVERGESILREMGFREFRVRVHGDLARIEIAPKELERALNIGFAEDVERKFAALGFRFVTLDLKGFRSGAFNESGKNG